MNRRRERHERRQKRERYKSLTDSDKTSRDEKCSHSAEQAREEKFTKLISQNEDALLNFVASVNKLYQEKLGRPAPFMTFVICGMQSAGKSTIMERFMQAPLNIIQEGTGTRCPLDTTCIHDSSLQQPKCELSGKELDNARAGHSLSTDDVFKSITAHNKMLADEDRFSTESLHLVYRAKHVQNMRFVDTPGIISNKGTGQDNRDDIKRILRDTMKKPNSKLCVLVEPKEFSTNPIIDFCDDTFGTREKWTSNSIVLMTKFDKQLEDSRSGNKANNFFKEFNQNHMYPYLVITPTLPREDLPPDDLLAARKKLLENAQGEEEARFEDWRLGHEKFRETCPDDDILDLEIKNRIGFSVAKEKMREVMLMDTAQRLPEVLRSLKSELADCQNKIEKLYEKRKLADPREIKLIVGNILHEVSDRINAYLDGDLEMASKFPETLMDLDEELEQEEESEWCTRKLGRIATPADEEKWRERISSLIHDEKIPDYVYMNKKFLGGKQFQRAVGLMRVVMEEAIPDPTELKDYVASGAGYLQGGLQRENWERATLAIVKMSAKQTSHPAINFFTKHVGSIFRRLFLIGIQDVRQGSAVSETMKLLPPAVETHLVMKFEAMVWDMMENAAGKIHVSLEPMYSSLNPNLPTFHPIEEEDEEDMYTLGNNGHYQKVQSKKETREKGIMHKIKSTFENMISIDETKAKEILRSEGMKRATEKKNFLSEERTAMINDAETDKIITSAFQYTLALHEQIQIYLNFQVNHYLYKEFKDRISTFSRDLLSMSDTMWKNLVPNDNLLDDEIKSLKDKIAGLQESLQDVKRMQENF